MQTAWKPDELSWAHRWYMNICAEHQAAGSKHVRGERTCVCTLLHVGSGKSTWNSPSQPRLLFTGCGAEFSLHVRPCLYFGVTSASLAVCCVYLLVIRCNIGELAENHRWKLHLQFGDEEQPTALRNSHLRVFYCCCTNVFCYFGIRFNFLKKYFFKEIF